MGRIGVQLAHWVLEDFNRSEINMPLEPDVSPEPEDLPPSVDYTMINTWTDGYMHAGRQDATARPDNTPSAAFLRSLQDVETRLIESTDLASAQVANLLLTAFACLGVEKRMADTAGCVRDLMQLVRPALRGAVPTITLHSDDAARTPPTVISQELLQGGVVNLPVADHITISWGLGEAHVDWPATMQELTAALAPLIWAAVTGEENSPTAEPK